MFCCTQHIEVATPTPFKWSSTHTHHCLRVTCASDAGRLVNSLRQKGGTPDEKLCLDGFTAVPILSSLLASDFRDKWQTRPRHDSTTQDVLWCLESAENALKDVAYDRPRIVGHLASSASHLVTVTQGQVVWLVLPSWSESEPRSFAITVGEMAACSARGYLHGCMHLA